MLQAILFEVKLEINDAPGGGRAGSKAQCIFYLKNPSNLNLEFSLLVLILSAGVQAILFILVQSGSQQTRYSYGPNKRACTWGSKYAKIFTPKIHFLRNFAVLLDEFW